MKRLKLGAKFSFFLVLIFLIGGCLKIFTLSHYFTDQAERTIQERAELVLTTMQGVRDYTQANIQPKFNNSPDWRDGFILESVPSFSAKTVFSNFRQQAPDFHDFSYKEVALNPTNLDDRADEFESSLFKQLQERQQSNQSEILSGYRTLEGHKLFYLARPLVMKDASCLACHGKPSQAPQSLIKLYGDQNGFGWKLDDVIAAQMVYVPADNILDRGRQNLFAVTKILLGFFVVLFFVINLLLWRTVIRPLKTLTKVANQISSCSIKEQEDSHRLEKLTNRKDEPGQLARAFQYMLYVLGQREQDLQMAVQERTLWLEQEMHERQTAQESLQTYSHAISHDLRNLTMGISSLVQGILFQTFGTQSQDGKESIEKAPAIAIEPEALTMIQKSCDRQLNLMNSLMTAESTDIWRDVLDCKSVNLRALTTELQLAYGPKLLVQGSTINNFIAADLPDIQADPSQLKRVFENFIDNALKYNPEGVVITLNAMLPGASMLRCTVQDNGIGIDAMQDDELFGIYTRGYQTDAHVKGYGLGLYICRKIVEAHGGMIGVERLPKGGAGFWFTLPL